MELIFHGDATVVGHGSWRIKQEDGTYSEYPNVVLTDGQGEPDTVSVSSDAIGAVASLPLFKPARLVFRASKRGRERKLQVVGVAA